MENNIEDQIDNDDDTYKILANILKESEDLANTPVPPAESPLISKAEELEMQREADNYAAQAYESVNKAFSNYSLSMKPPPRKPRRKRYIGALASVADMRRELTALYKEAYYGTFAWADLSRATYALDCMARAITAEQSSRVKRK